MLFPALSGEDETYYHYSRLKTWVLEMCDVLQVEDEIRLGDLLQQWNNFTTQNKPLNFTSSDPENILAVMDRNFVEMCSLMEGKGATHPAEYSITQFYSKIDYIQKEAKRSAPELSGE